MTIAAGWPEFLRTAISAVNCRKKGGKSGKGKPGGLKALKAKDPALAGQVEKLLQELRSGDEERVVQAVEKLKSLGKPIVGTMIERLSDRNRMVKMGAMEVLQGFPEERMVKPVAALMEDGDEDGHEEGDDGDDDEQFDEGEGPGLHVYPASWLA